MITCKRGTREHNHHPSYTGADLGWLGGELIFDFTGCHVYIYSPDEQRKAWKTRTPFHPRYRRVLSGWHIL